MRRLLARLLAALIGSVITCAVMLRAFEPGEGGSDHHWPE